MQVIKKKRKKIEKFVEKIVGSLIWRTYLMIKLNQNLHLKEAKIKQNLCQFMMMINFNNTKIW